MKNNFNLPPLEEILERVYSEENCEECDEVLSGELYEKGLMQFRNKKFDLAIKMFNKSISSNPRNYRALCRRAICKNELGNLDGAMKDCESSIKLCPEHDENELSFIFSWSGRLKEARGDYGGAMEDYSSAIETNPADSMAYKQRARLKYKNGDLRGALKDCDESIKALPTFSRTYILRAQIKHALGDLSSAREDEVWANKLNIKNYNPSSRSLRKYLEWQERAKRSVQ